MSFEEQIIQLKHYFSSINISMEKEGGCRFLRLPSFLPDPDNPLQRLECLLGCDPHLGYESRLWLPKVIKTSVHRNWNHKNTYILGKNWFAFSFKASGKTLLEKLLSHYQGTK